MKGGDISNRTVSAIGVRYEGVVNVGGVLNRAAKAFIDDLFLKELNVFLIALTDQRKALAFCYKWNVFHNGIFQADSLLEIPELCQEHDMLAYFDADSKIIEMVGNRGANRTEAKLWTAKEFR